MPTRDQQHWLIYTAIAIFGILCYAIWVNRVSSIHLEVANVCDRSISNIFIETSTEETVLPVLGAGKTQGVAIRPKSESTIVVGFYSESGKYVYSTVAGYVEPGYEGYIRVTVSADGTIECIYSNVNPPGLIP